MMASKPTSATAFASRMLSMKGSESSIVQVSDENLHGQKVTPVVGNILGLLGAGNSFLTLTLGGSTKSSTPFKHTI